MYPSVRRWAYHSASWHVLIIVQGQPSLLPISFLASLSMWLQTREHTFVTLSALSRMYAL